MVERTVDAPEQASAIFRLMAQELASLSAVLHRLEEAEMPEPALARAGRALCLQLGAMSDAAAEACGAAPTMTTDEWIFEYRGQKLLDSLRRHAPG